MGHHLEPVVLIGKEGPSAGVASAVDSALQDHELVKLRLGENVAEDRHFVGAALAAATDSELVQVLGRTLLLYRPHPTEPKITP
jgi:RNA-binding protein